MNPPANSNQYSLLNSVNGWHTTTRWPTIPPFQDLVQNADGTLSLQTLPGEARLFTPDLAGKVTCAAAVVCDECGLTYVLDAAADRVVRIDSSGTIETLAEFGGSGSQPRQFEHPRGLVLVHGCIAVSDTGNHRVQVFSAAPYALVQLWGRADSTPGNGQSEFHWPWSVAADAWGNIYVADRGNGRVQKIALDGTWLAELGVGVLKDPTELAISRQGTVAVVDGAAQSAGGVVQIFPPDGSAPIALPTVTLPRAVAFDEDGNLYVASGTGLVYHFAPNPASPGGYACVGAGVTGLDSPAVHMTWTTAQGLLVIFQNSADGTRQLWSVPPAGSFVTMGVYVSDFIDSWIENCPWDRVTLLGSVPKGSSVEVEYFTAAYSLPPPLPLVTNPNDGPSFTFASGSKDLTCLVQAQPGELIQLRLTFRSDGKCSPKISAIKVFFPRQSYLQYLPAVYQQDPESRDFLDRFLSLFQATFDEFDAKIDSMWKLFDPDSVPPKYFDWLAAWLQLPTDPTWPMAKKRAMLKKAVSDYGTRGTVAGILQAIKDYSGVSEGLAIVEHFRLRNWPLLPMTGPLGGNTRLWSRQFYQRLQVGTFSQVGAFLLTNTPEPAAEANDWGANEFSVFFPADPYNPSANSANISAVVEREKPAHTKANYIPVLPRFRVGVQATLGVDTSVACYTRLVLGSLSRLCYDAILNCSRPEQDLERLGVTARPITGVNTRLF